MDKQLKQKLNSQYQEMWPATDWKEIIGSTITGILILAFAILYFSIL